VNNGKHVSPLIVREYRCGHSFVLGLFERVGFLFLAAQLGRLGKDSVSYKRPLSDVFTIKKEHTHITSTSKLVPHQPIVQYIKRLRLHHRRGIRHA